MKGNSFLVSENIFQHNTFKKKRNEASPLGLSSMFN